MTNFDEAWLAAQLAKGRRITSDSGAVQPSRRPKTLTGQKPPSIATKAQAPSVRGGQCTVTHMPAKANKTERDYFNRHLLPRLESGDLVAVYFEGMSIYLENGHRYTVDFLCYRRDRGRECHEVKGGFRLQSERSARASFDLARVAWPEIRWFWAVKGKCGWKVLE